MATGLNDTVLEILHAGIENMKKYIIAFQISGDLSFEIM